jgi:hypothetical protein
VQGVQDAVQKGLDSQAAGLTEGNAALAELIAQLEQLGAGAAAAESQQCSAPCVDLRAHPILHSSACVCAEDALAGMGEDAREAAYHAVRAVVGECGRLPPGLLPCADFPDVALPMKLCLASGAKGGLPGWAWGQMGGFTLQ